MTSRSLLPAPTWPFLIALALVCPPGSEIHLLLPITEICARFALHRSFRGVMAFSNDASDSAVTKEGRKRKWSEPEWRPSPIKWRTQTEQRSYSSKFLEALHRVRRSTPEAEAPRRSRALREAADRALAVAARGRTRWSRAILSSRSRLMIKPRRPRSAVPSASVGVYAAAKKKKNKSPVLKGKAAALGRLVPGCQKISFPSLLEEASDYIPALEMQVRAMAALVEILSASSGSSSPESNP